jgi:predicted TPR repeat methyltransferase
MRAVPRSSGDVLADRRYEYARALAEDGDHLAAADLIRQALELVPGWIEGWMGLAEACEAAGDVAGAREAFGQVLAVDAEDRLGASLHLARLSGETPIAPPAAYVRDLFDAYSRDFEVSLVEKLGYDGPDILIRQIEELAPGRRFARALDLGCGTGLMGMRLRDRVGHLEGVDLSSEMVALAAAKGLYDALRCGEALADLTGDASPLDLVTAADVFCYLGDLRPVLTAARARVAKGGFLAFSVELGAQAGFRLLDSCRFSHHRDYLATVLKETGWTARSEVETMLRMDRGIALPGLFVVAD